MPFKVPSGWVWTIINEVGNIVTGSTPQKDIKEYYGGSIPFYKPNDLEQGINTLTAADHLSILGFEQSRKLPINSVLVTCIGATIGKTGRILKEGTCNQQINAVIHNQSINPLYLYYILVSEYFQHLIRSNASATTLPILNKSNFSKLRIPLPPLSEQQRIVEEIERWFKLIDIIEQGKADLQTTIKQAKNKILELAIHGKLVPQDPNDEPASELLKRVNPKAEITCDNGHSRKLPKGWYNTTLANMCNTTNGLWKGKKPPFVKVGVIRNANFTKYFTLDYSKIEYIDVEQRAFEKKHLLHGDLIVEKSGGSDKNPVGRAIFFDGEDGLFSFSNFTMCMRCKDQTTLMSKYLFYLLLCIYSRGDMVAMQTQTTGLHNLLVEKFMAMTFPLPPFAEQKRIVQKIEELFSLLDCIEKALQA